MKSRKGFTLLELVVAMTILFILIYMISASFVYMMGFNALNKNKEQNMENMDTVLSQITKELKQTITIDDGTGEYGVDYPVPDSSRDLATISSPNEPLSSSSYLQFKDKDTDTGDDASYPILRFYIMDSAGVKHRISYTLGVPTDGNSYTPPHYEGTDRKYWANKSYEPCEILYSNETWDSSTGEWTGIEDQPITEQVITDFNIMRPSWSDKVIQIEIESYVKSPTSSGYSKLRYIGQITIRQ